MSLLMDALKKAEEEKKRAAKRLQEVEMDTHETTDDHENLDVELSDTNEEVEAESTVPELYTETAQFSLEPLSLVERADEIKELKAELDDVSDDSNSEEDVPAIDTSDSFSEDLTLENTVSQDIESQDVFEETQKAIDLNDTTIIEGLSAENASAPFDDTFHGVLFEEDEQETDVYEETLPGVPADQLVKDLGGGQFQPTPVAAKTVFSTARPDEKKSSFKWGILAVLALLAIGSFAIFYYFTITPVSRNLPSPLVARGIESNGIDPAQVLTPPVIMNQASEVVASAETEIESDINKTQAEFVGDEAKLVIESEMVRKQEMLSLVEEQLSDVAPDIEEVKPTEPIETKVDEVVSNDEDINEVASKKVNEADIVDESIIDVIETKSSVTAFPENIRPDTNLINISKSKKLEKDNAMLSQAFNAYQDGHYEAAESIYESVLKSEPDNRDAHLGLAAIAISNKDRKAAYAHYVHLLELNPLDTLSMNALIGLSNSADPVKDESAIKLLIQREGDVPYLYFSLGNLYAKQRNWANAQQAFFDAYRLDTTNPDYVLNLAISLDQMGQYDAALDYYKTAIDLSRASSAKFDSVTVNKRILVLSKLIKSKS